jgi:ankyrin repeat protein
MSTMKPEVEAVLRECEKTGSWYGIVITNLDQRNNLGDTPLHTVCTWGNVESVKLLLEAGAKVNALGDRGSTPLFNAVMGENLEVVNLLLASGADIEARTVDGRSAIEFAENVTAPEDILVALRRALRRKGG